MKAPKKMPPIELVKLADLKPYSRNANLHPPEQIADLKRGIEQFGFLVPCLIHENGEVLAGHGRLIAATEMGLDAVPCIRWKHLDPTQRKAFRIYENQISKGAVLDLDFLRMDMNELSVEGFQVDMLGFENWEMENLLRPPGSVRIETNQADETPDLPNTIKTNRGDVWILGKHRLMCGDSTDPKAVRELVGRSKAKTLHADPPYGMGKEKDGVANDNLRGEKLDNFQYEWWQAWRKHVDNTGSVYIWGNAPDLWRFYWCRLDGTEDISIRNEVVWDKDGAFGQSAEAQRCYPPGTERLLFLMLGRQGFGNINTCDFFEGFEPIRVYLDEQFKAMKWKAADVQRILGVQMLGHWITKSQWQLPARRHYERLQSEAMGQAFTRTYFDIRKQFEEIRHGGAHQEKQREFWRNRAYFDNTHDNMTDVWRFPRVAGDERYGHATPKPVDIMARICNSSVPKDGLILEPFAGTGSTLIGAEMTDRRCFTMELKPAYCDVVVTRWQALTGKDAKRKSDGKKFKDARPSK